jgi:hypothetical protein
MIKYALNGVVTFIMEYFGFKYICNVFTGSTYMCHGLLFSDFVYRKSGNFGVG